MEEDSHYKSHIQNSLQILREFSIFLELNLTLWDFTMFPSNKIDKMH